MNRLGGAERPSPPGTSRRLIAARNQPTALRWSRRAEGRPVKATFNGMVTLTESRGPRPFASSAKVQATSPRPPEDLAQTSLPWWRRRRGLRPSWMPIFDGITGSLPGVAAVRSSVSSRQQATRSECRQRDERRSLTMICTTTFRPYSARQGDVVISPMARRRTAHRKARNAQQRPTWRAKQHRGGNT